MLRNQMNKTEKELALLHGLYVENEWTPKFTDIFDKHCAFSGEESFLYLNAGAGSYAISLREKLDEDAQLFAVCETEELQKIAQAKAEAIETDVVFSTSKPYLLSDIVLADSSLLKPSELEGFLEEAIKLTKRKLAFFVPTSGSFGEIYSYLWEVFLNSELSEKAPEVENLFERFPTVSQAEHIAGKLGLKNIVAETKNENFDFENGKAFIASPLIENFLSPIWFDFLDSNEKEQAIKGLAQKIDDELDKLSFCFSVKATVIFGEKS